MEVWRSEIKYTISYFEYEYLKGLLSQLMALDRNDEYWIRSVYFDTPYNRDWKTKNLGTNIRRKLRLRIYSLSDEMVKLEIKNKKGDYSHKETQSIKKEEALSMLGNDMRWISDYSSNDIFNKVLAMYKTTDLRPKVTVDYYREAYFEPFNDIRITFDKKISCSREVNPYDISKGSIYNIDVPGGDMVMEVKYNHFLPEHIKRIINSASLTQVSVSKYEVARQMIAGR